MLLIGMASAAPTPSNPYLDSRLSRVYCSVVGSSSFLREMSFAIHAYNASYDSQRATIINNAAASKTALIGDCHNNLVATFNTEYLTHFDSSAQALTALYFKSAFDYVRGGGSWAAAMAQYNGFLADYQDCVSTLHLHNCQPPE